MPKKYENKVSKSMKEALNKPFIQKLKDSFPSLFEKEKKEEPKLKKKKKPEAAKDYLIKSLKGRRGSSD